MKIVEMNSPYISTWRGTLVASCLMWLVPFFIIGAETHPIDAKHISKCVKENYSLFDLAEYNIVQDLYLQTSEGFVHVLKTGGQIKFDKKKCREIIAAFYAGTPTENAQISEKLIESNKATLLIYKNKSENTGFSLTRHDFSDIPSDIIDTIFTCHHSEKDAKEYSLMSWLSSPKIELYPYETSAGFEKGIFCCTGEEYLEIPKLIEHCIDISYDQLDGKRLLRFRGNNDKGAFQAWFAPKLNYLLVKFEYVANEVYNDKKWACRYHAIEWNSHNTSFYPSKYEMKNYSCPAENFSKNDKETSIFEKKWLFSQNICTLSNCNFSPEFKKSDFTFTRNISNYTQAGIHDAKQIRYVWLDGKIVPWTDELALAQARGNGFTPGVREPRFWLMAAGILMILFALGAKTREYFQNRKGA